MNKFKTLIRILANPRKCRKSIKAYAYVRRENRTRLSGLCVCERKKERYDTIQAVVASTQCQMMLWKFFIFDFFPTNIWMQLELSVLSN